MIPEIFGLYKDDLQINGYSILYMIEQAISSYKVGDFEAFGLKMGQIMHLANLPKANQPKKFEKKAAKPQADMRNLAEILQGFFSAAFGQSVRQQVIPACSTAFGKYDWTPLDNVV